MIFADMRKAYFKFDLPDYESGCRTASNRELRRWSNETDLSGFFTQIAMNVQFAYSERLRSFRDCIENVENKRKRKEKQYRRRYHSTRASR